MQKGVCDSMKGKLLALAKAAVFLCLGAVIFWKVQDILIPNWTTTEYKVERLDQKRLPTFDVLFLGPSHVHSGISPMELYRDYEICSLNLGTMGQPMGVSCFLLERAYDNYSFEVVFLDVGCLFLTDNMYGGQDMNNRWRSVLDSLAPGSLKYSMAKDYAENSWSDGFLSAMLPLFTYHTNWTALTAASFHPSGAARDYDLGQDIYSKTVPAAAHYTPENIDYATNYIHNFHSGKMTEAVDGIVTTKTIEEDLDTTSIPDENLEYLLKIANLCKAHGTKLVLFKVPTMRPPQWYASAWTRVKSGFVSQIAQQYGLEFWDLQFDADIGLSRADTFDGGVHLNSIGAEKVSNYIGARIMEEQLVAPKADPIYDKYLRKYQKVFSVVQLQTTGSFYEYLDFLKKQGENWTVLIAASDDYMLGATDEDLEALREFGLPVATSGEFRDSYIGIVSEGKTMYEAVSDYKLEHRAQIAGNNVSMVSKNGWILNPGRSIRVNGIERSMAGTGLNFVIYDNETGCVLDSVVIDNSAQRNLTRNQNVTQAFLSSYEAALCAEGSASK